MEEIKMTSSEWMDLLDQGITILDADGWQRDNFNYSFNEELISKREYMNRLTQSTVLGLKTLVHSENE